MNENIILGAIFVAVLIGTFAVLSIIRRRVDVERNISSLRGSERTKIDIDALLGTGNRELRYYLDVVQNAHPDSLRMRLVQAGYFHPNAIVRFNIIRFVVASLFFFGAVLVVPIVNDEVSRLVSLLIGGTLAGVSFILCSYILERIGLKRMREYRKIFPDLMDLLLVCVDAGLSIDAAIDRVTREFLRTVPGFGVQLAIVNLEVRAGRPLHEALTNFATRVRIDEARTLAVLFRQSQELGASVSRTLRTFAREMRQMRIIRAEEKANTLPLKMLFPMAFFMFPVSLIIVLVPILMTILDLLVQMAPG